VIETRNQEKLRASIWSDQGVGSEPEQAPIEPEATAEAAE
jgi:hypothetical protein